MLKKICMLAVAGLFCAPFARSVEVAVGDIQLIDLGNGTTQFTVDNFTGPTYGCYTPSGFPICTNLNVSGMLSYSYGSGMGTVTSAVSLAAPLGPDIGGNSYAPANFLLNVPASSFTIASFLGTLSPVSFTTDQSATYNSDGTVFSVDLTNNPSGNFAGDGFALLYTNATLGSGAVPEPSSSVLIIGGLVFIAGFWRRRASTGTSLPL